MPSISSRVIRAANIGGLAIALVTVLLGCASIQAVPAVTSASTNPASARQSHEVSITRTALLPAPIEVAFDFIAAEDVLPKILTGYGPLPAISHTSDLTGPWSVVGSRRVNHLASGHTLREEVMLYDRSRSFGYRIWDFNHPVLRLLASGARGHWTFESVPGGTRVTWTYTFVATCGFAALPLSSMTQLLWRGYMDVCLENSARLLSKS